MEEKLLNIQIQLKAPKGQRNNFGGYNYRSCEDIFDAVKPLLAKEKLTLRVTDELVLIGDRYYIKATAILSDGTKEITNTSYAREEETKKGMDGSQITGASSSYARKYALNGLFLIDDVKDSDSTNTHDKEEKEPTKIEKAIPEQIRIITEGCVTEENIKKLCEQYKVQSLADLTLEQASTIIIKINERKKKEEEK